jgi:hypothetical protein
MGIHFLGNRKFWNILSSEVINVEGPIPPLNNESYVGHVL